jgi:D-tyrosyl-tRNA(Tyr) deacylase
MLAVAERLAESGLKVSTGEFRAMMTVGIINEGPLTILIDSKKVF